MPSESRLRRRSQVAKAVVCKTIIHQFDSDRRLHTYNGLQFFTATRFFFNPDQSSACSEEAAVASRSFRKECIASPRLPRNIFSGNHLTTILPQAIQLIGLLTIAPGAPLIVSVILIKRYMPDLLGILTNGSVR